MRFLKGITVCITLSINSFPSKVDAFGRQLWLNMRSRATWKNLSILVFYFEKGTVCISMSHQPLFVLVITFNTTE